MGKNMKKLLSIVSMILCITIVLSIPTQALSETIDKNKEDIVYSSFDNIEGETEEIGNIVAEIKSSRTETSKEFMLDDGTTMLVDYGQPVHYKNDKGNWVEYNNTLVSNNTSTADEAVETGYTNKKSNVNVSISTNTKCNELVGIKNSKGNISWNYSNSKKSKAKVVTNNKKLKGNEKFTTMNNLISEVNYDDIYDNVNLECFVSPTGVKENIVLENTNAQNEFEIEYNIKGLKAKQDDKQTIKLYKGNKEVYTITAPYMYDANGNESSELTMNIVSNKSNTLIVKLTADKKFLNSWGRAYPVTIDPEITVSGSSNIDLAEVSSTKKDTVINPGTALCIGGQYSALVKSNNINNLESNKKVISAKLFITPQNISSTLANPNAKIDAYEITSSWNCDTATFNTVTYDDTKIIDYAINATASTEALSFDITKTFKKWVDGTLDNNGIYLKNDGDSIRCNTNIGCSTEKTPKFQIIYKDYTGTESNLTYNTVSVGENAESNISYYTGSLSLTQNIYEGSGSRMPVHITATYNSVLHDKLFANGSPAGYGWQFSFNQYIKETDSTLQSTGYDYIYTDEDGTEHYFKEDESSDNKQWNDEDGLDLTLTKDENYLYITDSDDVVQKYNLPSNNGNILSETDKYGNVITYTYNTLGNLTKITDGSGREIKINYAYYSGNSEPRVYSMELPDGDLVKFAYFSNQLLACVTFSDEKQSWFSYTQYTSDGLLNKVEQRDCIDSNNVVKGMKYSYTYNSNNQVEKISEYGSNGASGNFLNFTYNDDNTTKVVDKKGLSETYTFNNSGETISVLNANGYLSKSSDGLSISGGTDSFTKNYITESTEQSEIKNGNYYFTTNGDRNGKESKGGTAVIDTSDSSEENGQVQYLGTSSIKVNNPVSSTNSAFFTGATHQFNTTELNGKNVTFSTYVKTKNITEIYSDGAVGAILKIKCFDSSGNNVKEVNSIGIDGTQDWQRISVTADIPDTTSYFRVYCMVRYASGTAWFDCLQLEEGDCANDFNALQNGNFESNDYWLTNENKAISSENGTVTLTGEAGSYDNVESVEETTTPNDDETQPATRSTTVTETVSNDSITTYDDYGNVIKTERGYVTRTVKKTYEIEATETTTESATEETATPEDEATDSSDNFGNKYIYQNVKVGKAGVSFNIFGEAVAKSVPLSNETRTFGIALNIYYKNNPVPENHYQEFNAATTAKQSVTMAVTPEDEKTEINYVAFAFVYGNNENTMTAYNAMLNIAPIYSSSSTDEETENENDVVDYEVISETLDTSKEYMVTSSTYDVSGNYASSETDEAGNTVTYTYDTNGNKTSVTDGNGNAVNYTYNSHNDVTSINSNGAENQYSYGSTNSISAITHNGFDYTFNYDVFNNLISTKIGDVALVANTYSSTNGNLTKTTYANGDYIKYTYDKYNNITKLTSETGVIAEFVYNKKGLVAKAVDKSSSTTTYYYYDFNGTLTGEYRQNDGGALSYFLSYDSDGNKIEKTSINGQTKTITTGTDGNGKSYVSNDGINAKTTTDDFGRTTQIKTSCSEGNSVFFTDYEYASGKSKNSTTNLVSELTQTYGSNELVNYKYIYDSNSNITQIYENGTLAHKYTYDNLNQLKEEYDYINRFYINYSYDKNGNIQSKNEQYLDPTYNYPSGKPKGNVYYYNDTQWKDKLTKINGYDITYDASGNPLNYRNGMTFTWQNGRQLASLQTEDNEVNYKYDSNGMRTQKTDNSGTTYYYYDSDKNLIGLTKGSTTLLFYYDSDGSATSFKYNGIMYYYIKNLQSDVVKIINQSGTEVVGYVYDAWGNIQSTTGDTTLGSLNPLRYRGYVYDDETGLYYLQSRYYDPTSGRFINADDTAYIGATGTVLSTNLFTYCENNAINKVDSTGYWSITITRGMVAGFIDLIISIIPGVNLVGKAFSPLKLLVKHYSRKALQKAIRSPIKKFLNAFVKIVGKVSSALCKKGGLLKSFGKMLSSWKIAPKITTFLANAAFNKFINFVVKNIDIVLSIGGLVSGFLDILVGDKILNNKICTIKIW
jgi:RHS repeat-associated protein